MNKPNQNRLFKQSALLLALFIFALSTIVSSCKKEEDTATLALTPAIDINFPSTGGSQTVAVTTNQVTWNVTSSETWCAVAKGESNIVISAVANTDTVARIPAIVTVVAGTGSNTVSKSITVNQTGAIAGNPDPNDPDTPNPNTPTFEGIDYDTSNPAVVLTDSTDQYIAIGDTLLHRLTFTANTPANMIPKEGETVIVSVPTDDFPNGLLAKATYVMPSPDGSTVIDYEPLSIEEAFSSLSIDTTGIDLANYVKEITYANGTKVDYTQSKSVISNQLTLNIPELVISNDDETASITTNMGMTLGMRIQMIIYDNELLTFRFVLDPTVTFDVDFDANVNRSFVKTKPILTVACAGIPVGPIVITPIIELSLAGSVDGKFGIKAGVHYVNKASYGITYERGDFYITERMYENPAESPVTLTATAYAEGGISAGLETSAGIGVYGSALYSTIGLQEKIRLGGYFQFDINSFSNNAAWYSAIKNSMLTTDFTLMGAATLKSFGDDLVDPYYTEEKRFRIDSVFIVPHYNKIDVTTNNSGADFKLQVTNNILLPVKTGVNIYNYSGYPETPYYRGSTAVDSVEFGEHKTIPQNSAYKEFTGTISSLEPGKSYVAVPYFEMDGTKYNVDEALEVFTTTADFEEQLRDLLMDIYNSAGGSSWTNKAGWNTDANVNTWEGVEVYPQSDDSFYYVIALGQNALSGNLVVGNHLEGTNCYWALYASSTDGLNSIKIDDKNFNNFDFPIDNVTHLEIHSQSLNYGNEDWNSFPTETDHRGRNIRTFDFSNSNINSIRLAVDTKEGNQVVTSVKVDNCQNLQHLSLYANSNTSTCPTLSLEGSNILQLAVEKLNIGNASWLSQANYVNTIYLFDNVGEDINFSNLDSLEDCSFSGTYNSINITGCNALFTCNFGDNSSVDNVIVSNCSHINNFTLHNSTPAELTINNCPEISNIIADSLSTFSITKCGALEELNLIGKGLTEFSISECDSLKALYISNNALTSLTLTNFPVLDDISCNQNLLESLSITNCPSITRLYCSSNQLTGLMPDYLLNVINAGGMVSYDQLYYYASGEYSYANDGVGFYYEGEPESMRHAPASK